MLDTGEYATLEDLARAKGVNVTYVSRVLRLTLLAPETVEAILHGSQLRAPADESAAKTFPLEWERQACHQPRIADRRRNCLTSWTTA